MQRSRSFIHICCRDGAPPALKSASSPRSPSRHPTTIATPAGCRAAILNCTPADWPDRDASWTDFAGFAETRPVHGECGGYMVLGTSLTDGDGIVHEMAGLLSVSTSFAQRKLHLGYRQARLIEDSCLGRSGSLLRGHEFHYASIDLAGTGRPIRPDLRCLRLCANTHRQPARTRFRCLLPCDRG